MGGTGRRPHGEEHHGEESHPWAHGEQPRTGASAASHQAECRVRLHQVGADHGQGPAARQQGQGPRQGWSHRPLDVIVPAQNTGMGPEKTSFFQALSIPTKITKGTIEIISDVALIKTGDKVGMSESTLLNMLKISPFTYGLIIQKVYDSGSVFDPEILDITDEDLLDKFKAGIAN